MEQEQKHFSVDIDISRAFQSKKTQISKGFYNCLDLIKAKNTEQNEEGHRCEAIDLIIGALAMYYARGGEHLELLECIEKKLTEEQCCSGSVDEDSCCSRSTC